MDMKKIIAIIRDERAYQTKTLLKYIGVKYIMDFHVRGKGQPTGFVRVPDGIEIFRRDSGVRLLQYHRLESYTDQSVPQVQVEKELVSCFIPKRMLIIIAEDNDVSSIVDTIININKSGRHGDGKIFICPMVYAMDIEDNDDVP
ncbi:MAG: P-II family nitrogen regulator [Methanoregula sp.]|nr:P-II family nitrogen regulator [Methanoregula sp.]